MGADQELLTNMIERLNKVGWGMGWMVVCIGCYPVFRRTTAASTATTTAPYRQVILNSDSLEVDTSARVRGDVG